MPTEVTMWCSKEQRSEWITSDIGNKIDQLNSWINRLGITIWILREKTWLFKPEPCQSESCGMPQQLLDSTKLSSFPAMLSMEINRIDDCVMNLEDFVKNV